MQLEQRSATCTCACAQRHMCEHVRVRCSASCARPLRTVPAAWGKRRGARRRRRRRGGGHTAKGRHGRMFLSISIVSLFGSKTHSGLSVPHMVRPPYMHDRIPVPVRHTGYIIYVYMNLNSLLSLQWFLTCFTYQTCSVQPITIRTRPRLYRYLYRSTFFFKF